MVVRILLSQQQQGLPPPHIQEADDGDAAVRLVQQEMRSGGHFDFILMDYIMVGNWVTGWVYIVFSSLFIAAMYCGHEMRLWLPFFYQY